MSVIRPFDDNTSPSDQRSGPAFTFCSQGNVLSAFGIAKRLNVVLGEQRCTKVSWDAEIKKAFRELRACGINNPYCLSG